MIFTNGRAEGNIGLGFAVPINTVRELLPQLHNGKVIRGRIGLSMTAVPRDSYQDFGLKSRAGALVSQVSAGGPAEKGGVKPGDVILEFNSRPVTDTADLQKMVAATKPGTSVGLKVVRDGKEQTLHATVEELDLDAERNGRQGRKNTEQQPPEEQGQESFGLTLSNLTPQMARRLQLPSGASGAVITEVDPDGPSAGALRQGDVIVSVNGQRVANAADAGRELQRIQGGRIARVLVLRDGVEVFVTVRRNRRPISRLQIADCILGLLLADLEKADPPRSTDRRGVRGSCSTILSCYYACATSVLTREIFYQRRRRAAVRDLLACRSRNGWPLGGREFHLAEAGAGNGRLAADILGATSDALLYQATRLHLIEMSAARTHSQYLGLLAERLARRPPRCRPHSRA